MPTSNTTYDYAIIDECTAKIRAKAQYLEGQAGTFSDESTALVQNFWGGETAEMYKTQANDIITDLLKLMETLSMVGNRFDQGATNMIETDMKGSKKFSEV